MAAASWIAAAHSGASLGAGPFVARPAAVAASVRLRLARFSRRSARSGRLDASSIDDMAVSRSCRMPGGIRWPAHAELPSAASIRQRALLHTSVVVVVDDVLVVVVLLDDELVEDVLLDDVVVGISTVVIASGVAGGSSTFPTLSRARVKKP